jgi:4-carboxymuconolactone decarboxylase
MNVYVLSEVLSALSMVSLVMQSAPLQSSKPEVPEACQSGPLVDATVGPDRFPEIPADKLTEAQKKAVAEFQAGRGVPVFGPFVPLLRSPQVMLRDKAMADYLRFKTVLAPRLRELTILITAREWTAQYEWYVHCPIAMEEGLNPEIAKAVAEGRRPAKMPEEEEIIYDFSVELQHNRSVSDQTYAKALARFGEQGVVDLVALNAFYTLQAMVLNAARTPVPKGSTRTLRPFPH